MRRSTAHLNRGSNPGGSGVPQGVLKGESHGVQTGYSLVPGRKQALTRVFVIQPKPDTGIWYARVHNTRDSHSRTHFTPRCLRNQVPMPHRQSQPVEKEPATIFRVQEPPLLLRRQARRPMPTHATHPREPTLPRHRMVQHAILLRHQLRKTATSRRSTQNRSSPRKSKANRQYARLLPTRRKNI